MLRTIWGDPERFKKTYYPDDFKGKYYLAGDGASRDDEGYFRIMGRIDDVLNVSGHRLGHDGNRIGAGRQSQAGRRGRRRRPARRSHRRGGVRLRRAQSRHGPPATRQRRSPQELRDWVAKEIGPIAKPKDIRFGDNLPKTRSGKIMRRLLRSIAKGEEITQDVSTLENPAILDQLKEVS